MLMIDLFLSFFKIGLLSVGGGLATLPFLYELARTRDWISVSDISNLIAISESTPGPLGVNMSTYAGFLKLGPVGAVTSTIGLITPSIITIIIVAKFLDKFKTSAVVKNVFYGLRASYKDFFWQGALMAAVIFAATKKLKWHPIVFIAISAVIGIVFQFEL